MIRLIRTLLLLEMCLGAVPAAAQSNLRPPPTSTSLPALPPAPQVPIATEGGPPPPPPPVPPGYPKHYEFSFPVEAGLLFKYYDFQLPAGQINIKWVAVDGTQKNISSGVELIAQTSPPISLKVSPNGIAETFLDPRGSNVRVLARRKDFVGTFVVSVSIDLGLPQ